MSEEDAKTNPAQGAASTDQPQGAASTDQPQGAASTDGAETAVPTRSPVSRKRMRWLNALVVLTSLLAVVGMLAVYANRLVFNPDNWSNTSTQLLANPAIRSAASNYMVDQLYAHVDVAGLIKNGLPPRFQSLAGPVSGALRNAAVQGTNLALTRPLVQTLWARANRAAAETLIAVVNGGKGAVGVTNGAVTLNLSQIIGQVATRLGLPASVISKLPPNIGTLTVFKAHQLHTVQQIGKAIKGLALGLTIAVFVLYGLAIALARGRRRRMLMTVGFSLLAVGLIGALGRKVLVTQVTDALTSDASLRPAFTATIDIATQLFEEIAIAFIIVGVVTIAAAWFAGPAGVAVTARRAIAPFLREQPIWTYTIVAVILVLIFIWQPIHATGTPVGIIVFTCLALLGTEALRRQTEAEFPDARPGDARAALRARFASRNIRRGHQGPAPNTESVADQLERLATLRDQGQITAAEYDSAKSSLLHA